MRVVGVNRTKHRGIGRLYRSGGGRVAGGGGGGGGGMPVGTRGKQQEEEATGYRDGGSWYRGWRWQSQCPSARTGSRRVAANDPRQFFTLHRASRRAKRAGDGGRTAGRKVEGPRGKKREKERTVG